ncbi:hypothetical protein TWF694_008353 [Orbilia ellipsospora]|uniref:Borealin N-terminal domain-containing protein n=1 Tax=Orbilia ellipsospora TaxID=2528407 RepID=A0AAV9XH79_9PEZI
MPPVRRKKKSGDSSDTSAAQPGRPPSRTASATSKSTTSNTTTSRTNPLGNKTTRPVNSRNSPEHPASAKPATKTPISRQNSTKQQTSKPTLKSITIPPPETQGDMTPVSPISPVAHEHNQISIREITPPSGVPPKTQLVQHEAASPTRSREIVPQTPTTAMKKRSATRKISRFEKDRLIENIRIEVDRRAKALRQRYILQAEMLRQGIELRVGRIPYKMRNMTMGELYDQAAAAAEAAKAEENRIEAKEVVKELEDIRRLSNQVNEGNQLIIAKSRASPPKPVEHPPPSSPIKPATIKLVPRTSPVHVIPAVQASSPIKPQTMAQKAVAGVRAKLGTKKSTLITTATTASTSARTTAKTAAATASAAAAAAKATKGTRGPRTKATTPATTAAPTAAAPKKTTGRALRSRK